MIDSWYYSQVSSKTSSGSIIKIIHVDLIMFKFNNVQKDYEESILPYSDNLSLFKKKCLEPIYVKM